MKSTDPRVLAFISQLREECRAANVRIILKNLKSIRDWDGDFNDGLDGYFTPPKKGKRGYIIIAAGVPLPTTLHTLAHEFVHFRQWRARQKLFTRWSYHKLEARTEKSALKLLEEHDLPINLSVRRKKSRAYIRRISKMHL